MVDFAAFNVVLDDIVFPDGKTAMGILGGGGPQTAFGMRLWTEQVGLFASVGSDFPESARSWLAQAGIDATGLLLREVPSLRAWQVMEVDGQRTQIWRVTGEVLREHFSRSAGMMPLAYQSALGYHLGIHPLSPNFDFISQLRALGGCLSLETFCPAQRILTDAELEALLSAGDVFSCNLHEGQSLTGCRTAEDVLNRLLERGAKVVSLRMGAEGCLLAEAGRKPILKIAAYPTHVIDPLGAGNAFCGGFLVGWQQSGDLLTAGLQGAVSASFMVEQVGLPVWSEVMLEEAVQRFNALRSTLIVLS